MSIKRLNSECIKCLLDKYVNNIPEETPEDIRLKYMKKVLAVIAGADECISAPELTEQIVSAQEDILGSSTDYSEIKSYFNRLMLSLETEIESKINASADPFKTALLYAMVGNFIDFGAMKSVDENRLIETLGNAQKISLNETEIENLRREIKLAKNIVYLTDNCGEIVLDKLFIKELKKTNPKLNVNVIVRGKAVLNDCTIDDAKQVDMFSVAKVVPNGTAIAGTCIDKISIEASVLINNAEVIIAKGQGNFETLRYCGKNIYYLFLCKCEMFARRFDVKQFSGMLINDMRMCIKNRVFM